MFPVNFLLIIHNLIKKSFRFLQNNLQNNKKIIVINTITRNLFK